jgi:hypothetical protein
MLYAFVYSGINGFTSESYAHEFKSMRKSQIASTITPGNCPEMSEHNFLLASLNIGLEYGFR